MSAAEEIARVLDERALRRLVELYAQAADRRDPELFVRIMTADVVIEGEGFKLEGREQIRGIPAMIEARFIGTNHFVMNHVVTIDGAQASGETYCLAYHRYDAPDGTPMTLDWAIRYQDRYRREGGEWLIAYRRLIVDWEKRTPVERPAATQPGKPS
jgi:uncharacterized protein (TIGR02246 family)